MVQFLGNWLFNRIVKKLLQSIKNWIERLEIRDINRAKLICNLIPSACPFEMQIKLFNRTLVSIPPLCQLNPVYNELIDLRFRALSYLGDRQSQSKGFVG